MAFGTVRQLPSTKDTARKKYGRWNADYNGPNTRIHTLAKSSTMQNYQRVARVCSTQPYGSGAVDKNMCSVQGIALAKLTKADVYRWAIWYYTHFVLL